MQSLEYKIKLYDNLKRLAKQTAEKLEKLGTEIKAELGEGKHTFGDIEVQVQVRDRTSFDPDKLEDVIVEKGLAFCMFTVDGPPGFDPAKIELAYHQGLLSDDDLRRIRKPQYNVALVTKKVDSNL